MYVVVLSGKSCMVSVGICAGKSYIFCIMLCCLNPSSEFICSLLRQLCVFSVEYVFTCTCFGNILPSLGIVYTNVKLQYTSLKIKNNIKYIYILILIQTIVDVSEFRFTVICMQWSGDVTVPIFVGMHYLLC